jgi:hypothetical protein
MAETIPVSSGWIVLVRPVGTILPDAVAMMSTWPKIDQATAIAKNRMIVPPIALPAGEAGVSRISRAAGRNWRAVSPLARYAFVAGSAVFKGGTVEAYKTNIGAIRNAAATARGEAI